VKRENKDININRPTFCILPWIHLQTKPNGQVKPCCRFDHRHPDYKTEQGYIWDEFNVKDKTFSDIISSDVWQKLRSDMLDGKIIAGCSKCYREESSGGRSMRTGENDTWFRELPSEEYTGLKYYEFALGSFCNLKCRTCDADLSHTWKDDTAKLEPYYNDRYKYKDNTNLNTYYDKQDLTAVEVIKFTGGEPMLHPNFIDIIDHIIDLGRAEVVSLNIFTNCSWVPKKSLLQKLRLFKKVTISVSIDGLGKVNDYIRNPSKWNDVESAVRKWLSEPFDIVWHPTFSVYNIWQTVDMVEWWINIQQEVKGKDFWTSITRTTEVQPRKNLLRVLPTSIIKLNMVANCVTSPSYLSCAVFPNKDNTATLAKRNDLLSRLDSFDCDEMTRKNLQYSIKKFFSVPLLFLAQESAKNDIDMFGSYTADLDKLRNESLETAIPQVYSLFDAEIFKGRLP